MIIMCTEDNTPKREEQWPYKNNPHKKSKYPRVLTFYKATIEKDGGVSAGGVRGVGEGDPWGEVKRGFKHRRNGERKQY